MCLLWWNVYSSKSFLCLNWIVVLFSWESLFVFWYMSIVKNKISLLFSMSVVCLFRFLLVSIKMPKVFKFKELQFINFIIYSYLCYLRTVCLHQESKVFSYIFLKWLYCFRFYIKVFDPFELIFVNGGVRVWGVFFFFWGGGLWDLNSLTRDQILIPCTARQMLNYWTTREVSKIELLILWYL